MLSGNNGQNVAALFRTIGSNRVNNFTLAVLYGACLNPHDPTCKLLNLYPVTTTTKCKCENGRVRLQKCQLSEERVKKIGDGFIKGHFRKLEFPQTFKSFYQAIQTDRVIKAAVMKSTGKLEAPRFENQSPLTVAYTFASQSERLKRSVLGAAVANVSDKKSPKKRVETMKKYKVRAANLKGHLLHKIKRSGPKNNTAVVMAINDTLEPHGACLPYLAKAVRRVIAHFVMAVVVAGLPKGRTKSKKLIQLQWNPTLKPTTFLALQIMLHSVHFTGCLFTGRAVCDLFCLTWCNVATLRDKSVEILL